MRGISYLRLFLCAGLLAVACGRTDLDLGPSDLPVATGSAGSVGSAGSTGAAGASTGAGGDVGTGSAGATSTGAAGAVTGAAGSTSTGAAGTRATTGAAGATSTGAAGTRATTGAAGSGTTTGTAGTGPGMPPPSNQIPCGAMSCFAGMQTCCVQIGNGGASATCIAVGQTCGGAAFSCTTSAQCSNSGGACCAGTVGLSTMCESPARCLGSGGIILCAADADCPAARANAGGVAAAGLGPAEAGPVRAAAVPAARLPFRETAPSELTARGWPRSFPASPRHLLPAHRDRCRRAALRSRGLDFRHGPAPDLTTHR